MSYLIGILPLGEISATCSGKKTCSSAKEAKDVSDYDRFFSFSPFVDSRRLRGRSNSEVKRERDEECIARPSQCPKRRKNFIDSKRVNKE